MKTLYGGIEGGGTKFVCAVGTGPDDIRNEIRFPTTTPDETLGKAIEFFRSFDGLAALGVACFGPLDPHPASPTYGRILPTPKPGWTHVDVVGALRAAFDIPIGFDTDVNGAALAETRWGAGQGCDPVLYLTIGTGIGGGAVINGNLLHGLIHPEMGHILIPHDFKRDPFAGICPFHSDCFEGLASGPALEARWGRKAETLSQNHPAWQLEAHYIALALSNFILTLSPQRIILGGGVMSNPELVASVQHKTRSILNNYVQSSQIAEAITDYIVAPGLAGRSGVLGGFALARQSLD